jgi:hypothetical protein
MFQFRAILLAQGGDFQITTMQNPSPLDLTRWAFYVSLPDSDDLSIHSYDFMFLPNAPPPA